MLRKRCLQASIAMVCGVLLWPLPALAQRPPAPTSAPTTLPQPQPDPAQPPAKPPSQAERIAGLQRTIADNERLLAQHRATLADPAGEYAMAEQEFTTLDKRLTELRRELDRGEASEEALAAVQSEAQALEPRWKLAKERFDLAIRERRTLQEQIAAIEQKLQQDRVALEKLLAPPTTQPSVGPQPEQSPAQPAQPSPPPAAPPIVTPTVPGLEAPKATDAPILAAPKPTKELIAAQEQAQQKQTQALQAEAEVQSIGDRIEALNRSITLEHTLLETARGKVANAQETQQTLDDQIQRGVTEGIAPEVLRELWARMVEARARVQDARREVNDRVDRLDHLQAELASLQAEQISALQEAEARRLEAEHAQKLVEKLENPLSYANLRRWVVERGPRLAGIVLGMIALLWLARVSGRRIVRFIVNVSEHGSTEDRENRAQTLVSVFRSTATVVIVVGGLLMMFTEAGLNVTPLLGGAAVVGLAVAFGAQNLIRDFFYGFMILLENQYGINDVIKVGTISGQVERITLRITVLRDLEGTVHFIPNGQINTVSNMTHGWSRALFDIRVAYTEDVNRVMQTLVELGREMRREAEFRYIILDEPEMLGVDRFDDSSLVVRFLIKTRPLKQWGVKREMLRRIKARFDELGIQIPIPLYRVTTDGSPASQPPSSLPGPPVAVKDE